MQPLPQQPPLSQQPEPGTTDCVGGVAVGGNDSVPEPEPEPSPEPFAPTITLSSDAPVRLKLGDNIIVVE